MDKEIKQVVFTFKDGSEKVLEGKELLNWEVICSMHSDSHNCPANLTMCLLQFLVVQ